MGAIRTRATAVINLYDYYKGNVAETGNISITVKPKCNIVLKPQGTVVLLEVPDADELEVCIESRIYEEKVVYIRQGKNAPLQYHIWLWPKRNYPFAVNTAFIKGSIDKENTYMLLENRYRSIRLLDDYKQGDTIIQLSNIGMCYEGRVYSIRDGEGIEFFRLEEESDEIKGGYHLAQPLKRTYRRGEVLLNGTFPMESGNFRIGLSEVPKEGMRCWLYEGEVCLREFSVSSGTEYLLE